MIESSNVQEPKGTQLVAERRKIRYFFVVVILVLLFLHLALATDFYALLADLM